MLPSVHVPNSKTYLAPVDIVGLVLQQRIHGQVVDALPHDTFDNSGALTVLNHIVSTVSILNSFASNYADICLMKHFMSWEIARSLSIVSRWYTDTGPMLAKHVFDIHMRLGKPGLQTKFPSFAELVDRIMLYIKAAYTSKSSSQTRKQPKLTSDHDKTSVDGLRRLHVNIFGPPFTSDHTFDLPLIEPHLIGADEVQQYTFGQQCFVQVISNVFICPGLISIDAQLNGPSRKGHAVQSSKLNVLQGCVKRSIIRGALIDAIVEACNGDDGVLSSSAIESILRSPAFLFDTSPSYHTNDEAVVKKLLKDPVLTLAPIRTWLEKFVTSSTNTLPCVKKLGDAVYDLICERHGSRPFPRFNPLQALAKATPRRPLGAKSSKTPWTEISDTPLTPDALLENQDGDTFSQLAVIIREALNRRQSLPDGDVHIARIMRGYHPTTGLGRNKDLDHFDPIRLDNTYSRMLKRHFSTERLLSIWGLTNLFIWMSTGQGYLTQPFVNRVELWFTLLDSCTKTFRDAIADPQTKCCNTRVWGTTCASFAVQTQMFTVEEKFAPFFSDKVQKAWKKFLGALFESDDVTRTSSTGQLPTYTEALEMLTELSKEVKLNGFNTGLTRLQFANNLVILGLCQPPTVAEIAEWIHRNPTKGADKPAIALDPQSPIFPLFASLVRYP
jgi:hypothetical protein